MPQTFSKVKDDFKALINLHLVFHCTKMFFFLFKFFFLNFIHTLNFGIERFKFLILGIEVDLLLIRSAKVPPLISKSC